MLRFFRRKIRDGRLTPWVIVIVVFLVSAMIAAMFNYEGNTGAQVAEAAGRVNRQVDDTKVAFTGIKELIPEEHLEAAPLKSHVDVPTSGGGSTTEHNAPADPVNPPMPPNTSIDENNREGEYSVSHGTTPADAGGAETNQSVDENNPDGEDPEKVRQPTLTFNEKAREIQGDRMLTLHQEAMERIVDNWTPRYEAAKREHEELVTRIADTRALWPEYQQEQVNLIGRQGNQRLREIMHQSLISDTRAYDRWHQQASDVEMRSAKALRKIEDMK